LTLRSFELLIFRMNQHDRCGAINSPWRTIAPQPMRKTRGNRNVLTLHLFLAGGIRPRVVCARLVIRPRTCLTRFSGVVVFLFFIFYLRDARTRVVVASKQVFRTVSNRRNTKTTALKTLPTFNVF